nr:hypothetical protein GCM10017745_36560 [Saccharothrix mutabilis subsp. capreolus]
MNLTSLGLTADQERVYRHLLRSPGRAPTDLDGLDVPAVLAELHELEVVDATHTPVPPAVAVDRLIRRRVEETSRELHNLSSAWVVVRDLVEEQTRAGRWSWWNASRARTPSTTGCGSWRPRAPRR